MDYFAVTFPAGAKLGMSVVERAEAAQACLGNAVVSEVKAEGLSRQGGVEPGDFVLSVNEQYVAFEDYSEIMRLLKAIIGESKELTVHFARPNKFDWQQIQRSPDVAIKEGMVNKLQMSLFKKWNSRTLKVTRETINYSAEGVLKGKYSVDTEVSYPRASAGYPLHQGVFEVRCGDKDMVIQTSSTHGRNMWMHAIECAKRRAFDRPLPADTAGANWPYAGQGAGDTSAQAQQQVSDDGLNAYLQMGRAAMSSRQGNSRTGQGQQGNGGGGSGGGGGGGHYKILSLSKVQAVAGPENVVTLDGVKDPSKIELHLVDYDFGLENKVLSRCSDHAS